MNQSFYESSASEKLNKLRNEGMTSQAYYRSHKVGASFFSKLPKLILVTLIIIGLVQFVIR